MSRVDDASKLDAAEPRRIAPTKLRHAAARLVGREDDLLRLDGYWNDGRVNVVVIRAWGGVGKTSLVAEWMASLAPQEWRGARWVLDWTFYSQGTRGDGDTAVSADLFIAEALAFFGDPDPQAGSPWDRGARLAGLMAKERGLLVLDGVEPLQHPPGPLAGQVSDPALLSLLKGLARQNAGLCVVTTREPLVDLGRMARVSGHETGMLETNSVATVVDWPLETLSDEAGAELLHGLGVTRAGAATIEPSDCELLAASREVGGHALTLQLMGNYLRLALDGDIRQRDLFKFAEADAQWRTNPNDVESPYGHAFKVIWAYERWLLNERTERTPDERLACRRQLALLRLLGLFNRPADAGCLRALRRFPAIAGLTDELVGLDDRDWKIAAQRLEDLGLAKREPPTGTTFSLDAHPLVRDYFASRMKDSAGCREAHSRLFDHLCKVTEYQPATLARLQPLYQAVAHGCLAGRQREACEIVHYQRIGRGDEGYSLKKLGAFGVELDAISNFFERPWSRVSAELGEPVQAWLLNGAGFALGALGRLTEAVEPMQAALAMRVVQANWRETAVSSNLSELELMLGRVSDAQLSAEQSVVYAAHGGNQLMQMVALATQADALHQSGRRSDAMALFREAESLQASLQPKSPLLYSLRGFRYCDLLLADVERTAWQRQLAASISSDHDAIASALDDVERRAKKMLDWRSPSNSLLTIALDHLTLSRVWLYRAITASAKVELQNVQSTNLPDSTVDVPRSALEGPTDAVNRLRSAGQQQYLPLGLLTRAWHLFLIGNLAAARADLDEAWEIAERGPMPLFQVDIHLTRARLFFRDADYPWQSPQHDLAEARRLIEKHGYGRRVPELDDAEVAINDPERFADHIAEVRKRETEQRAADAARRQQEEAEKQAREQDKRRTEAKSLATKKKKEKKKLKDARKSRKRNR